MSQYAKIKDAVKNSTASARHHPNKLSPTDSCKSKPAKGPIALAKKPIKKRKAKCPNCKQAHSGTCLEPEYEGAKKEKKKTTKQKQREEKEAKLDDVYQTLFG